MVTKEHERIGLNILCRRKMLNMTQKEVASLSGISKSKISSIEHGKSNFTIKSLMQIADALEVDYKVFLK